MNLKQTDRVPSNTTTLFYSGMTTCTCFGLKRPSFNHHYKNFKIRYDTVQTVLVVWDPV